jgi:hypothetical protein
MRKPAFAALSLALLLPRLAAAATAVLVGSYDWRGTDPAFGGFSGLELSADGRQMVVLSDRGHIAAGTVTRTAEGAVAGVSLGPLLVLRGEDGKPLPLLKADSEGLALAPDGHLFVSFERVHRVLDYPRLGGTPAVLPRHPDFRRLPANRSLEALAIDRHGWLWTTPEGIPDSGPLKLYRFRNGRWDQPATLPRPPEGFLPTGADFGPDGRLYLLERDYSLLGFRSRVVRFTLGPDGADTGEVLLQTPWGRHDNLEGIAVWRDTGGAIRLTLVSDDNFSRLQKTQLVDYRIAE